MKRASHLRSRSPWSPDHDRAAGQETEPNSVNWRLAVAVTALLVHLPAGDVTAATFHSSRLPHAERSIRVGFWFGMSNNQILTPETIDWIGERASIVILNGTEKGIDPYFHYENVVARFKKRSPDMPILLYDWLQHDYQTGEGGRVGGLSFERLKSKTEWQVKDPDGRPLRSRALLLDVRNREYREYLVQHVAANVERFGTDGVAFDTTLASLDRPSRPAASRYLDGGKLAGQWPEATLTLLQAVKQALGPNRYVLFNGLFHNTWAGRLSQQAGLLKGVDAAAVEFFGRNVHVPDGKVYESAPFNTFVYDYVELLRQHPDKIIPVFARSPRYVYLDYEEDYRIQRYCLCSFLLAMTPLSTYKYHSHFQTNYHAPGRTYGMSYYADYDLDVGDPVGQAFEEDGIYQRRFTKAWVAVAPMHQEGRSVRLSRRCFSPEGEVYEGTVQMPPATGMILLLERPAMPSDSIVIDDFEDGKPGMWRLPVRDGRVTVEDEGGNRYLRVRSTEDALYPYHERRVQAIRSLVPYHVVRFRMRSTDPGSAMLVRVEVSDSSPPAPVRLESLRRRRRAPLREEARTPYVVLVIQPEGGSFAFKPRDADIPYGQNRASRAPYFRCPSATYRADGKWHTITFDTRDVLAQVAPHLRAHRIPEMRLIGEADLDDIVLGRGEARAATEPTPPIPPAPPMPPPNVADLQSLFRESFDSAEPKGWFERSAKTELKGTDVPGWYAELADQTGSSCGLVELDEGNRAVGHEAKAGEGEHCTRVLCRLPTPIRHAGTRAVRLNVSFRPLSRHTGGPNPWNKQFPWALVEQTTGQGYGMAFDIQANDGSPENRLLRIDAFAPTNLPNCDNLRPGETGFWVGPRMSTDLKGVRFDVSVTFVPLAAQGKTRIAWRLVNTRTGAAESGERMLGHVLATAATLDTIQLAPTRWAHGTYDELAVEVSAR